jgi:hypothetical protein
VRFVLVPLRFLSHLEIEAFSNCDLPGNLTEFRISHILSFDTDAESNRVQERKRMRTALAFWRRGPATATSTTIVLHRPDEINWLQVVLKIGLSLMLLGNLLAPFAARAQNLGTSPQFGQAVQGQQATTVEGTVLNMVNWGCNVIAPVIAVACLGVAGWHFKSGRGYMGWGVTGVALMVISGLGRMAEGFITQAQGIQ